MHRVEGSQCHSAFCDESGIKLHCSQYQWVLLIIWAPPEGLYNETLIRRVLEVGPATQNGL